MRKVIDVNMLTNQALDDFLNEAVSNIAVLTDSLGKEIYKGNPSVDDIYNSFKILSKFPDQVVILKGARELSGSLQDQENVDVEQYYDYDQINGFPETLAAIKAASMGHEGIILKIEKFIEQSNAEFGERSNYTEAIIDGINAISSTFSEKDLKIIRTYEKLNENAIKKIMHDILLMAALLFKDHPETKLMPTASELRNSYIFRFSLSNYCLILDWIERGGLNNVSKKRMGNDIMDMTYVAYATFFDGLLTNDDKMKRIYIYTCVLLEKMFP